MEKQCYLACDLGSSDIKLAVGSYNYERNSTEILAVANARSKGIERGLITSPKEVCNVIRDLMYKLNISNGDVDNIYFNLSAPEAFSENASGELVFAEPSVITEKTMDDLDRKISSAARRFGKSLLFIQNKKFFVDGEFSVQPVGEKCSRFSGENFLFFCDARQANALAEISEKLELGECEFTPDSMLAAETCTNQNEREMGVVVVDVGYEKTDIAIYTDGCIQACHVLPVGILDIVNTFSAEYMISYDDSLYIFDNYSNLLMKNSDEKKFLGIDSEGKERWLQIGQYNMCLEAFCQQIMDRVVKIVEESEYGDRIFSGYILAGEFANIRGIASSLAECVDENYNIKVGKAKNICGLDYISENPRWFVVLGALKMMAESEMLEKQLHEPFMNKIIGFFSRLFPSK